MRNFLPICSVVLVVAVAGCATPRTYLKDSAVKVTEVHFDPSAEQGQVEFIELGNTGSMSADVSLWQVTGAGRLVLPAALSLEPGKCVVVTQDAAAFAKAFPDAPTPMAVFEGKLKNSGETIRVEDARGRIADEARYDDQDPEVVKASDTGLSLHRVDYRIDYSGKDAELHPWKAGKPTPGVLSK